MTLGKWFQPDIIVGASIGSLNGWSIAGGATGEQLGDIWRAAGNGSVQKWKLPRKAWDGIMDSTHLDSLIRQIYDSFTPKCEFGVALTEIPRFKRRVINREITWVHLAASCAVPGVLPQRRIDGQLYTDGGFLGALPAWGAAELGATHILGINVMPPLAIRLAMSAVRILAGPPPAFRAESFVLTPSRPLGGAREALQWNSDLFERWLDMGRREAENISLPQCFER